MTTILDDQPVNRKSRRRESACLRRYLIEKRRWVEKGMPRDKCPRFDCRPDRLAVRTVTGAWVRFDLGPSIEAAPIVANRVIDRRALTRTAKPERTTGPPHRIGGQP